MAPLDLEPRVRVDAYSNVRAIAETADGRRYMTGRFVQGLGRLLGAGLQGRGRPRMAALGQMKLRWFDADGRVAGARRR